MAATLIHALTEDGWEIALHRWQPAEKRHQYPVVMLHGIGANRINLDLDKRYSVARAAHARGFDVFVVELRGAGLSRPPGGEDRTHFQWGFGDYVERDMPAVLARIQEETGCEQVHGFGHSMGGMVFYALGVRQNKMLRSITSVGTPLLDGLQLGPREKRLMTLASKFGSRAPSRKVPFRRLMGAAGMFIPLSARMVDGLLLNSANVEPEVLGRMAREAIADIPMTLLMELGAQISGTSDANSPFAYESQLAQVGVPTFALGGSVDRVAPPSSVEGAISRVKSPDVRYREMGLLYGDRADYGHIDLLVGRHAPDEVFPLLLDFLEEVD